METAALQLYPSLTTGRELLWGTSFLLAISVISRILMAPPSTSRAPKQGAYILWLTAVQLLNHDTHHFSASSISPLECFHKPSNHYAGQLNFSG
jgi:hypothetical protein